MASGRGSPRTGAVSPDRAGVHLILIGLPGSGKSTVGRAAAARLGRSFVDLDSEIERREGRTVARIFEEEGEPAFRAAERAATLAIAAAPGGVVAAGGGWMTNPGAPALLRPPGLIIYLAVTPERALERMGEARRSRPLLSGTESPLATLRNLLAMRADTYATADVVIETEALALEQVVERVVELGRHLWNAEG